SSIRRVSWAGWVCRAPRSARSTKSEPLAGRVRDRDSLDDAERDRHALGARQAVEIKLEPRPLPVERKPLVAAAMVQPALECHVHRHDLRRYHVRIRAHRRSLLYPEMSNPHSTETTCQPIGN